ACCATRSSCCEGGLAFWRWRDAQLGLARRAVQMVQGQIFFWSLRDAQLRLARRAGLPYFSDFVSGVCAARRCVDQG
ncbi:hypothetical protein A2U01_0084752, partial [Trifolium medium]|nr:hypothetical protein [Trifolium medium]